jgi:hypothetical protein
MTQCDPQRCRRALREIGEIAAVAILPDSQITDQEALQSIAVIADWVRQEAPGAPPNCGDVIEQLHRLTDGVDLDALSNETAVDLFGEVLGALETSEAAVFAG